MIPAPTYQDIVKHEVKIENEEIVILLFMRPNNSEADDYLRDFDYIHYNSGKYCSIFAVGYTDDKNVYASPGYSLVCKVNSHDWYFSNQSFAQLKGEIEELIDWQYSGETELIILQNWGKNHDKLDFSHCMAINISDGIRKGYITSYSNFMEKLIRTTKTETNTKNAGMQLRFNEELLTSIMNKMFEGLPNNPIGTVGMLMGDLIKSKEFIKIIKQ